MPSLWKRFGLAAALASQIGLLPNVSFAQQPQTSQTRCGTIQPCPPIGGTGRAHVGSAPIVSPSPEPPKWTPTNPAPVPTPSPMTDPMNPTPPVPTPSPMTDPMTDPMGTPQTDPMGTPPDNTPAVQTPPTAPDFSAPPGDSLGFNAADAGIGSPDAAFNTPNMMGDLLKGFRSVSFPYNGAGDFSPVLSAGAATLRNSKVSENNSAIPRTRVSFRYNYFHNANDVKGFQRSPQTNSVGNFGEFNQPDLAIPLVFPAQKSFDAHFYTLGFEKTFWEDMVSIEARIPFATALDSDQTFIASREVPGTGAPAGLTQFQGVPVNVPLDAAPLVTSGNDVLGNTDTELQDVSFILKGILWQSEDRRLLVSGGFGVTAPTGQDVNIRIVDSYDDLQNFEPTQGSNGVLNDPNINFPNGYSPFNTSGLDTAVNTRSRRITIKNEIWELAPYLAMVATPTNRTFVNGFAQVNLPLNSADVRYQENRVDIVARDIFPNTTGMNNQGQDFGPNGSEGNFRQSGSIKDQALLQVDIGAGYWLYQNPTCPYITGIASLLELHYTTTLEDANTVAFQPAPELFNTGLGSFEGPTRIGNLANRVDILNVTVGGVVQLSNSATMAIGYVAPLRDEFDRTFDGELNVQFNLYQ